jgi:hypothetical protein
MILSISVLIFILLIGIVIIFQASLAAGMPWGAASMGGKFPGKYPPKMRVVALINILILIFIGLIGLIRVNIIFPQIMPLAKPAMWVVVSFFVIGTVLNIITPSKIERIWAPVAAAQTIASINIALS